MDISKIEDHMEVVGSDGEHVGIVDHLEGEDQIKLTRHDSQADGVHHFIPTNWVAEVGEFVTLSKTAAEATAEWKSE